MAGTATRRCSKSRHFGGGLFFFFAKVSRPRRMSVGVDERDPMRSRGVSFVE